MTTVEQKTMSAISAAEAHDFLVHEAELIDDERFSDWHALFTADATYQVPLGAEDPKHQAYLITDDAARLDERVYHIEKVPFPSQSPRSETLHQVTNVRLAAEQPVEGTLVLSNQVVHEIRTGDFRQVGLGDLRNFPGKVRHVRVRTPEGLRIRSKVFVLLHRRTPMSNLTFVL